MKKKSENKEKKKKGIFSNYIILGKENIKKENTIYLRLSIFMTIVYSIIALLLFVVLSIIVVKYTSLKQFVFPVEHQNSLKLYNLMLKADSLEQDLDQKTLYINNIKNIISDNIHPDNSEDDTTIDTIDYNNIIINKSEEDSILRENVEERFEDVFFAKYHQSTDIEGKSSPDILLNTMYKPLSGIVTKSFDAVNNHYGIDIVSDKEETIKATLKGTVIFAEWTMETGYVIIIQHDQEIISVYKHNSVLLKEIGEFVEEGDPIAIVGDTGTLSRGTHLHFELWRKGVSINPQKYLIY